MKRLLLAAVIGAMLVASTAASIYLIEYPESPSCAASGSCRRPELTYVRNFLDWEEEQLGL